jgi:hypothetical protein
MTKLDVVSKALMTLGVGEQFSKKGFITIYWGKCDYFVERSFDVAFCNAKKEFPDREFRSKNKMITRIK